MDKITKWLIRAACLIIIMFGIGYVSKPFAYRLLNSLSENKEYLHNRFFGVRKLTAPSPSLVQVENLLSTWLNQKSKILSGSNNTDLSKIVNNELLNRLLDERKKDIDNEEVKFTNFKILGTEFISKTETRIVLLANIRYFQKVKSTDGTLLSTTNLQDLDVKYILDFSNGSWKLIDFISLDSEKKWPRDWNQFKSQPNEDYKEFITVRFTNSIHEACSTYKEVTIWQEFLWQEYRESATTKKSYYLSKVQRRRLSTAIEVLRQAGYQDWKLYSRYNTFGIGDLRREELKGIDLGDIQGYKAEYAKWGVLRASEKCEEYGYGWIKSSLFNN